MVLHCHLFPSFLYTIEVEVLFGFILELVMVMECLPSLPSQAAQILLNTWIQIWLVIANENWMYQNIN